MTQGKVFILEEEYVRAKLPKRTRESHKGTYGRAAIVGGSVDYSGAAYLSAAACLRSGAGYTTVFLPKEILPWYALKSPEILLKSTNDGGRYAFNEENMAEICACSSVAYGMGMGTSEEVAKGASYLLSHYEGKLILDADGLNSLAAYRKEEFSTLFGKRKCDLLLTPHFKEFSRLSGVAMEELSSARVEKVKEFAAQYDVCLLLKGATSIITDGNAVWENCTGNSGQAKGGSGDVLSGILAGLCAMGARCVDAACVGAFLAGRAAELASRRFGEYSLTASDCIDYLGQAFLSVLE